MIQAVLRHRETNRRVVIDHISDEAIIDDVLSDLELAPDELGDSSLDLLRGTIDWFLSLKDDEACMQKHINAYWECIVLCDH